MDTKIVAQKNETKEEIKDKNPSQGLKSGEINSTRPGFRSFNLEEVVKSEAFIAGAARMVQTHEFAIHPSRSGSAEANGRAITPEDRTEKINKLLVRRRMAMGGSYSQSSCNSSSSCKR